MKIITSSGFKSTILTDFVQGQLRVPFRFGRCLPEVHLFTGSCRLLRRLFDYARGSTQMEKKKKKKNRSRIYDLGVVPTRGNNMCDNCKLFMCDNCKLARFILACVAGPQFYGGLICNGQDFGGHGGGIAG